MSELEAHCFLPLQKITSTKSFFKIRKLELRLYQSFDFELPFRLKSVKTKTESPWEFQL